jgi:hypothetical protein
LRLKMRVKNKPLPKRIEQFSISVPRETRIWALKNTKLFLTSIFKKTKI